MHHIELTRGEPVAFSVHMRMHARFNNVSFFTCIDFLYPPTTNKTFTSCLITVTDGYPDNPNAVSGVGYSFVGRS